tara:strand:+ start:7751 stop:8305 length:555 start_codon:yes stop_codon:yes gene_type:complete
MLYSAPDIEREPESITAILVNPAEKKRFDEIYLTLEKSKKSLVSRLNRKSGIAKDEIEQVLLSDFDATDLFSLLSGLGLSGDAESSGFKYQDILSEDSLEILQSAVFIESARAFGEAYGDIFEQERSPFKRGVFNPAKRISSLLRNHAVSSEILIIGLLRRFSVKCYRSIFGRIRYAHRERDKF